MAEDGVVCVRRRAETLLRLLHLRKKKKISVNGCAVAGSQIECVFTVGVGDVSVVDLGHVAKDWVVRLGGGTEPFLGLLHLPKKKKNLSAVPS